MAVVLALLLGVVAGLRTMTAPAAVSWAAYLGRLDLSDTWLAFMGSIWAVVIFDTLGLGRVRHRSVAIDAQSHGAPSVRRSPRVGRVLWLGCGASL